MNKGVQCDQIIVLTGLNSSVAYPNTLRRIQYYDSETEKQFNFLTNNFVFSAQTIADLYRYRWQIELFFKWIKQGLRVKSFYGTSENAVKTQIWIAVSVYVHTTTGRNRPFPVYLMFFPETLFGWNAVINVKLIT
jgi:hypothetical protein